MRINGSHIWKEKVVNDQEYPDTCGPVLSKMLCSWFQIVRKFRLGKKNSKNSLKFCTYKKSVFMNDRQNIPFGSKFIYIHNYKCFRIKSGGDIIGRHLADS